MVGVRKGFDLFGIATLGVLTGVGGGILRDLLLDRPPYSIQHWPSITVALVAVAIATPFAHVVMRMNSTVPVLVAIGMGFSQPRALPSPSTRARVGSRRASSVC